jgi:4-hydroxy-tetrahydrodipicolinate reductase
MINVIQIGVGSLGQQIVKYALQRRGLNLIAAVDPDPKKAGKDLGTLCGLKPIGVTIQDTIDEVHNIESVDVALITTFSGLERIKSQVAEVAEIGLHIVTTCEELSYPWGRQAEIAQHIDETCKKNGVACLGTGVNPGFLMDYLPVVLTSVCQKVNQVRIERVQDASNRRIPFQKKIGAGLDSKQFQAKKKEGRLRHVGLKESVQMIAAALHWELDSIEESLHPVLDAVSVNSGYDSMNGAARGVEQTGKGIIDDEEKITLYFKAAVGEEKSYDKIEIFGVPSFTSVIEGGIHGDVATSAIVVNAILAILKVTPGLKTMLEMSVLPYFPCI